MNAGKIGGPRCKQVEGKSLQCMYNCIHRKKAHCGSFGLGGKKLDEITIRKAELRDLEHIHACENTCFELPWTFAMLYEDIIENPHTLYLVVEKDGKIIGYGGMWIILDEAHITNVCILPEYRGLGYAYDLMRELKEQSQKKHAQCMTLEVRVSNKTALRLYKKCGFRIQGLRKRYYPNNNEDAYVMWTDRGLANAL